MKNKKIIVTGGCGFIGSHLVDELVEMGCDVMVIDNLSAENERFYSNPKAKYLTRSITESKIIPKFSGVDCVFHLAAESRIGRCTNKPALAIETNAQGTLNVLEACVEHNVKKIIYSSTSSVYGLTEKMPISEESPIDCLNPYSASKYFGEKLIELYAKMHGIRYTIFRYFNVFGERSPAFGPYAPVLGIFLKQLGKCNLTIVGDGEQRRDFIHVSDVVNANLHIWKNDLLENQILNVGSGSNISINELANMVSKEPKVYLEKRSGEARNTLADVEKIFQTGWRPKIDIKQYVSKILAESVLP